MQTKFMKARKPRLPDAPVPIRQAAEVLGITERQLRAMFDGWQVLTVRVHGQRLVPVNELRGQLLHELVR